MKKQTLKQTRAARVALAPRTWALFIFSGAFVATFQNCSQHGHHDLTISLPEIAESQAGTRKAAKNGYSGKGSKITIEQDPLKVDTISDPNIDAGIQNKPGRIYIMTRFDQGNGYVTMTRPLVTLQFFANPNETAGPNKRHQKEIAYHIQIGCTHGYKGEGKMERQGTMPLRAGKLSLRTIDVLDPQRGVIPDQCFIDPTESENKILNMGDHLDFIDSVNAYFISGETLELRSNHNREALFIPADKFLERQLPTAFRKFLANNTGTWSVEKVQGDPCRDSHFVNCDVTPTEDAIANHPALEIREDGKVIMNGHCEMMKGTLRGPKQEGSNLLVETKIVETTTELSDIECDDRQKIENEQVFQMLKHVSSLHRNGTKLIITTKGGNSLVLSPTATTAGP
ncbi:MAG: hypothetical protein V4736_08275 [Bdellovibrionota bacterium]